MGQYYKPVILAENKKTVKAWVYSHSYGLKLMEHSWSKNDFVGAVEKQMIPVDHGTKPVSVGLAIMLKNVKDVRQT